MNLQQLEYILAVQSKGSFTEAAEHCSVTQATLSMMVRKLEDELGLEVFDRKQKPVRPTKTGLLVLAHAAKVLHEARMLKQAAKSETGAVSGEFVLAVIPTIAPYLLHRFVPAFLSKYPHARLQIEEMQTPDLIKALKQGRVEAGILATPLGEKGLGETHLYYEPFWVYAGKGENLLKKKFVLGKDLDVNRMWFLEEGHCLRTQAGQLCELKHRDSGLQRIHYEAGTVESLIRLVDASRGMTIVPELAAAELKGRRREQLRRFRNPQPAREISLVTNATFARQQWISALQQAIVKSIPEAMRHAGGLDVLGIVV